MSGQNERLIRRHLRFGWWALGVYLLLGVFLEAFHAMKAGFYLDVGNETRRLMFQLAHTHGTLLALVNILYALTMRVVDSAANGFASASLLGATLLMPAGFFLGGIWARGGDPGVGAALIPAGALALVVGVAVIATNLGNEQSPRD